MSNTTVQKEFQRREIKYVIDPFIFEALQEEFKEHLVSDKFAYSSISNVYFDSADYQMIKDSISHRYGSEKIRMRTYDPCPSENSQVFLEVKRKEYRGDLEIGHKYRLTSNPISICNYVEKGVADSTIKEDDKASQELALLRERYCQLLPKMYIHYERFSMKGVEDPKLRVTFDQDIIYRSTDVSLLSGQFGQPLVEDGKMVMEVKVKVSDGLPDWMKKIFDRYSLIEQSFSKYSNAYLKAHNLTADLIEEEASSLV